jgi:hypothetical protein
MAPSKGKGPAPAAAAGGDDAKEGAATGGGASEAELDAIYRRITLAVCPLFALTMAIATIDRNNLSQASISLIPTLKLSPTAYGGFDRTPAAGGSIRRWQCCRRTPYPPATLHPRTNPKPPSNPPRPRLRAGSAGSCFYATFIIGLVIFALLVPHVGARRVLAGVMVAWGVIATCTAFVTNQGGLVAVRLLLGLAESGAIPSMWAHLMSFFPKKRWGAGGGWAVAYCGGVIVVGAEARLDFSRAAEPGPAPLRRSSNHVKFCPQSTTPGSSSPLPICTSASRSPASSTGPSRR